MFNIQTLNKISPAGLTRFDAAKYTCGDDIAAPDAVLVRSAAMHDMEMPESLLAIARAGAGTNNIPCDKCAEDGIVVFNTPGANANAVKELVLLGLLISSRKVPAAMEWVKPLKDEGDAAAKMVEKGKSQFVGPEIKGKTLGVIGLGAIGILVANAAVALGMDVIGYDPYLSVNAALSLSSDVKYVKGLDEIYAASDYITVHVPCNANTKGMINADAIAAMKDGVRILNFARAELVADDILKALEDEKVAAYVTDFPKAHLIDQKGVIAIPHLGASTPESEDNCARMAADEVIDYLENGNIVNSVNMPAAKMARTTDARICVIHKADVSDVSAVTADAGCAVANMVSAARGDYAYTMLDVTGDAAAAADKLAAKDGVIRVRVI